MKRKTLTYLARLMCVLILALTMTTASFAADSPESTQAALCYPTAVTRSEDGSEIRKIYDLGPENDPAGIPRSDFEQGGFYYTLTDLLRQEAPEYEERLYTETVTVSSKSKDMESVLALLPQAKEVTTDDGLSGELTLKLETVNVAVAGYGSSKKSVSATRTYPGLADQDTQYIPKSIEDNGHTLTLEAVDWRTDGDGRCTAVATYTGTATSSYVKGYTVTADYTGTVSRIALNKVRYVAIFEGTPLEPVVLEEPDNTSAPDTPDLTEQEVSTEQVTPIEQDVPASENNTLLAVAAVMVVIVLGVGVVFIIKRRR